MACPALRCCPPQSLRLWFSWWEYKCCSLGIQPDKDRITSNNMLYFALLTESWQQEGGVCVGFFHITNHTFPYRKFFMHRWYPPLGSAHLHPLPENNSFPSNYHMCLSWKKENTERLIKLPSAFHLPRKKDIKIRF